MMNKCFERGVCDATMLSLPACPKHERETTKNVWGSLDREAGVALLWRRPEALDLAVDATRADPVFELVMRYPQQ